jgi:hypothetical protein
MSTKNLVPCLWRYPDFKVNRRFLTEEEMWMDYIIPDGYDDKGRPFVLPTNSTINWGLKEITPIYDCLHDDIENGQDYKHYHQDTRWDLLDEQLLNFKIVHNIRPIPKDYLGIIHLKLNKIHELEQYPTPNNMIPNYSQVKLNCLKCPHRGYDLSNVKPDELGIIICPLHGTKIRAKSKKVV